MLTGCITRHFQMTNQSMICLSGKRFNPTNEGLKMKKTQIFEKPLTTCEGQSKLSSVVEAVLNQVSGFILSLLLWQFIIAPCYNITPSWSDNFQITLIFAVASTLRSYVWRRIFNKKLLDSLLKKNKI